MATKNQTIKKESLYLLIGLGLKKKKKKVYKENRWPNLTPEIFVHEAMFLDSNCCFQPPKQTLLSLEL